MKVCLINPPLIVPRRWTPPTIFQPLGLAYIAAVLEKKHSVSILDACADGWKNFKVVDDQYYLGLDLNQIQEKIIKIKPEIVGISIPFSIIEKNVLAITEIVKKIDKNIFVFLGGAHASVVPEQLLTSPDVDFVIIGEGEDTILELVQILEKKEFKRLPFIKGIAYRRSNEILRTAPREFIQNLDALPFPSRHLLPMETYFLAAKEGRGPRRLYVPHYRWATVITSRGCPYYCIFCSVHLTMGNIFRARSPESVVQEIAELIRKYDIKHINLEDDNLTLDKQRFERICDLIIKQNLRFTWSAPNGIRADTIDENLVKKMKLSGCYRVFVAPESGVQEVVNTIIKKNLDLKKIEETVILFKKYGVIVDGSFVIGLPGETKEDIQKTIKFALKLRKLGMDKAGFHIATPYYGTELYQITRDKGYLKKDFNLQLLSPEEPLIETPEWTGKELRDLQLMAGWLVNFNFSEILRNPWFALKKIFLNFIKNPSRFRKAIKAGLGLTKK